MVSAAEQLAANINFSAFAKASELKKRILFTLGALLIYRAGTYIPMPGIDLEAFAQAFQGVSGGILGLVNTFAGGAVERMAIFALGVMPYISASIIMQLLTSVVPSLEQLKKEGEAGRKRINQYTRYGTVVLCLLQSFGVARQLQANPDLVPDPGLFFTFTAVITLTGGTMFLMWLGEQITARGIGNGVSMIIFAGIIATLPGSSAQMLELGRNGILSTPVVIGVFILAGVVIISVVFFERAQRRLLIQYPKRQVGNKLYQDSSSHLPLKLNTAGVIPPIFATSLLLLPATFSSFSTGTSSGIVGAITASLGPGQPLYLLSYGVLIVFFAFFYTSIVFNAQDTADNLKKHGGFIPGYRPGERTAQHIDYVLTRITVIGVSFLVVVCLLPEVLIYQYGIPFTLGGTVVLIIVSVMMDTVGQIQSHLFAHQYEGLIKKSKLRGGKQKK